MRRAIEIHNLKHEISIGLIKTEKQLNEIIDDKIKKLEDFRFEAVEKLNKVSSCKHVWNKTSRTLRPCVMGGYMYDYRRHCIECSFTQFVHSEEHLDEPEWPRL